jgi:hypothetical protein
MKKTLFKISILFNAALLAGLIFMLVHSQKQVAGLPVQTVVAPRPMENAATAESPQNPASAQVPVSDGPKPFLWHQLEAKNYHVYVKNLREIGCPEPTLRAIVTADVYAVYDFQANKMEKELSNLTVSSWTNQVANVSRAAALKSELARIPDEETAMINDLLGWQPAPGPAGKAVAANDQSLPEPSGPIALPLAMQNIDLSDMDLSDDQKQAIENVRQQFLEQTGGTNQDVNDPAYRQRWQQAQPVADSLMAGFLGNDAYTELQIRAYQMEMKNQARQSQ